MVSEEHPVDFFVSYADTDVSWAEWAAHVLDEAGFVTILKAWNLRPRSNFVLELHDALGRSDRVIILLSKAYWTAVADAKWTEAFTDPLGVGRILPVRVEESEPERQFQALVYVDLFGVTEEEAKRRLLAGAGRARSKPTGPPHPLRAVFPGRLPAIWNVPARNPNFAARDFQLKQLRSALSRGGTRLAVTAVSGLGGVGKTQLAIEHAWRRAADYDLVWWVPADLPDTIPDALARLGDCLGLRIEEPAELVEALWVELGRLKHWLMVFDDAESPEALAPYLPSGGGGQILITSRNPAWRSRCLTLDLDLWSESEAVAFLLARTGGGDDDEAEARAVAADLGLLPLALEQAGAYVEATGMTLGVYRSLLASQRDEMLGLGSPAFHGDTVEATFALAHDRAAEASPAAATLLGTCAFLGPDDIPIELLSTGDAPADEDALAVLRRLALVRRQGDSVAVHRLVGAVVRHRLGPAAAAGRASAAVAALREAFPESPADHRSWPRSARLLPHVLTVAEHAPATKELASLLSSAGIYLSSRAQLRQAQGLLERALAIFDAVGATDHAEVAATVGSLGVVLQGLGDLESARSLLEVALANLEAAGGTDHPAVAVMLTNLGLVQRDIGNLETARRCLERALWISDQAVSPDPQYARVITNLGLVLRDLGDLESARSLLEVALANLEAAGGTDHPAVAVMLTNLGLVQRDIGNLETAREHVERGTRCARGCLWPGPPRGGPHARQPGDHSAGHRQPRDRPGARRARTRCARGCLWPGPPRGGPHARQPGDHSAGHRQPRDRPGARRARTRCARGCLWPGPPRGGPHARPPR